ncbi:virion structural protein [Erwinia phage PhiEaH1]|jgi:hypothetical protein|uniref:YomR n=1 Tax=Erwinia phage PhiEaH1 TaxID=1401669 RepID=W8CZP9_9CAUD|nr:virion structural protein [Erwinia phage PhiEaH1]AGX01911.1 YomR [Erwinia phage PhiEaH1]
MALTKPKYPLDRTGQSAANRVIGEERTVDKQFNRAFQPFGGPFYGDSMVVTDKASGKKLDLGTDYTLIYPYVEATQNLGLPVYNILNLVNRDYDTVLLTYQVVGGPYSYSIDAIVKMMNDLMQDDRVVSWGNIWGKPLTFNPSKHLHAATDLYSLEYVVLALEELTRAVIQGDVASHNVIYEYINRVRQQMLDEVARLDAVDADLYANVNRLDARCLAIEQHLAQVEANLNAHIADKNNPHNTTKAQVGLGIVENYRPATQAEAEAGTSSTLYMTPLTTWQEIAKYTALNITPVIQAHINDKNNPHATTKAQVGLGSVENYGIATQLDAENGTSNVLYMTPLRTAQAVSKQALIPLNAHINNRSNPHGVTAAQVGLGAVQNYGIASQSQAQVGADNATYMTPLRTAQAINVLAVPLINAHANRQDNPHNVTKAQVGLGNVNNFLTANDAEAQAGTASDRYLTPRGGSLLVTRMMNEAEGQTGNQTLPGWSQGGAIRTPTAIYRIPGANFARTLSGLNVYCGSGERQYFYVYSGGDGIGDAQVMYKDTGNNGRNSGTVNVGPFNLPAVGVGRWNYIKVYNDTGRGTNWSMSGEITITKQGSTLISRV